MRASPRTRRIAFERQTGATKDTYGHKVEVWTPIGDEFAEVIFGTGSERRQAAQETATAPATFRVLDNPTTRSVTVRDRIAFDGGHWNIQSNVPSRQLNQHREITATRDV